MKKKILIVEDDNDSREIMNLFITRDGYEAIKGKSSNEVDCIRRGREPRPHFHGYGTARSRRSQDRDS
jgi:DNA-binding NtrC family response regulator